MNGHDEFLELVAASIDFELTDEEFGRLSTHLARCPDCRRAADEIRGGAAAIAALPAPALAPARAEQILRGALHTPPAKPRWGLLAVAAMLATLGGGILFAGFQLVNDDDSAPSEPPPSLVAEASSPPSAEPAEESADPGSEPTDGPPATPIPEEPTSAPDPAELRFPIPYSGDLGDVRVAPAPDDRLWVGFTRGRDTVLALLGASGVGAPFVIPNAIDCELLAAGDGSVRAICLYDDVQDPDSCLDGCAMPRVYAFSPAGSPLPGFPIWLPSGISTATQGAAVVGTDLVTVTVESYDEVVAEFGEFGSARITTVAVDGTTTEGQQVAAPMQCCAIGPNGAAYGSNALDEEGLELRTQLVAFDANGMRPGWPISVDGSATSRPAFGPSGQLVYASWIDEGSRIAWFNPDGSESRPSIDLAFPLDWSPNGDAPIPPLADERGRVWVVANGSILGFDADNAVLPGFPYVAETDLLERGGDCPAGDTGCQTWLEPPVLAPQSLIYTLENAPEGKGERLNVVNRDGSVRSGWPKTLQRAGAKWDSVTIGSNRIAYAVADEPESNGEASVTIVAYAPNGTVTWKLTVIEP